MPTDETPPLSMWPDAPVAELEVPVAWDVTLHDGWLVFDWGPQSEPFEFRELPRELALRGLLDLDVDIDEAVRDFLLSYGVIDDVYDSRKLAPIQLPVARVAMLPRVDQSPDSSKNHVLNARAFLHAARALTRHWIAHSEGRAVADAWVQEGFEFDPLPLDGLAWYYFTSCINYGLKPYTVRFEFAGTKPRPNLYEALCLQIANVVIEGLPPRVCANQNCAHYFIRQQGRAEHGQNRTDGVKFCSASCSRAQWQRDYRASKRRRRNEAGLGG